MKEDEMLPCPFCASTDLIDVERHPEKGFTCVRCRACGAIGPAGRGIEGEPTARREAIAHWNRRAAAGHNPGHSPDPAPGDVG